MSVIGGLHRFAGRSWTALVAKVKITVLREKVGSFLQRMGLEYWSFPGKMVMITAHLMTETVRTPLFTLYNKHTGQCLKSGEISKTILLVKTPDYIDHHDYSPTCLSRIIYLYYHPSSTDTIWNWPFPDKINLYYISHYNLHQETGSAVTVRYIQLQQHSTLSKPFLLTTSV